MFTMCFYKFMNPPLIDCYKLKRNNSWSQSIGENSLQNLFSSLMIFFCCIEVKWSESCPEGGGGRRDLIFLTGSQMWRSCDALYFCKNRCGGCVGGGARDDYVRSPTCCGRKNMRGSKQDFYQCCGSMTFWGGSGSTDPCLWLMDPDPGSRSWIRILLFSSLTFKMPAKN
jgi:hypothetical protein